MKNIVLSKESSDKEIKAYFTQVFKLNKSKDPYPVDLDSVWMLVYTRKDHAVRDLKDNFIQVIDYQIIPKNGGNKKVGRNADIYKLSASCFEYFIARKVRPVFEVYRQVTQRFAEEEANPMLAIERSISNYRKVGKSDEWIEKRLKGKLKRRLFTDCLQTHGVNGYGYAKCTNDTYNPLSNGNAISIKKQKGLSKTDNLRDSMSEFELSAIEFSETLSAQTIEKENLQGNDQCALACRRSSTIIAKILQEHNKPLF